MPIPKMSTADALGAGNAEKVIVRPNTPAVIAVVIFFINFFKIMKNTFPKFLIGLIIIFIFNSVNKKKSATNFRQKKRAVEEKFFRFFVC